MRRQTIILGLAFLNLGLLAGWAFVWRERSRPPNIAEPASAAVLRSDVTRLVQVKTVSELGSTPVSFHWDQIEATDYRQLLANLRAVQCPELTIQDILLARVDKAYAAREAALKLLPEHLAPWELGARTSAAFYERARRLRELRREKRALLKELLGVDVPVEMPPFYADRALDRYESAWGNLPELKREQVRAIHERFWDKSDDLEQRTRGFWEASDHAEYRRIRAERREALAQVLTPQELEEFELATSTTARQLRSQLAAFQPTEQEFRPWFNLQRQFDEEFGSRSYDGSDMAAGERRKQAQQQLEQQVRSLLGEARYAQYQRSQDGNFRNLSRVAEQAGLPEASAVQAYEVHRLARQEAARIRSDANLTSEQRQEALRVMQTQTDDAMSQVLGTQGYQAYQQRYGGSRFYADRPRIISPAP